MKTIAEIKAEFAAADMSSYPALYEIYKEDTRSGVQKLIAQCRKKFEFGRKHELTMKQAFNYLYRYQGMDFLDKHYDYAHTQSFRSMVDDITDYCHRKGGGLQ